LAEQNITSASIEVGVIDRASSAIEAISKSFGGLNKAASVTGAVIATTGFALIKLGKNAFNDAARVQELDIAMKAIGRSTGIGYKAINEASNAIRKNGIEMAASQQIAIEFAQNSLEIGKASDVARVAQDLAVIGAKNSTETTMLLTRAIITGRTELLKSAGVQKSAGQMYEEFAAKAGKSATALTAVEKQTAVLNGVLKEGEKVFGTYEAAMLAPGKILRSFPRILNDITVELGKSVTVGFAPVISETYNFIKAISTALRENEGFQKGLGALAFVLTRLTNPLTNTIRNLTQFVDGIKISGEQVHKFTMQFQRFLPAIATAAVALSTFAGRSLLRGIPMLAGFAGALNPVVAGFIALAAVSPTVREALTKMYNAVKPLLPLFLQLAQGALSAFARILVIVVKAITLFAQALVAIMTPISNFIKAHQIVGQAIQYFGTGLVALVGIFIAYAKITALVTFLTGTQFYKSIMLVVTALRGQFATYIGLAILQFKVFGGAATLAAIKTFVLTAAVSALKIAIRLLLASTGLGLLIVGLGLLAEGALRVSGAVGGTADEFGNMDKFAQGLTYSMGKLDKMFGLDLPDSFAMSSKAMEELTGQTDEQAQASKEAAERAKELAKRIDELKKGVFETVTSFRDFISEQTDTRNITQKTADSFVKLDMAMSDANLSSNELLESFKTITGQIKQDFSEALSNARAQLADAKSKFDDFRDSISLSIKKIVNFEKAVEGGDFLGGLIKQADDATKFSDQVKKLIEMGLSPSAITQVVEAGFEAGAVIADTIIAGGQTVVNQVNKLVESVETVANAVGYFGAQTFYQAGVDQAQALVNGIVDRMNESFGVIQGLVDRLNNILSEKARLESIADAPPPPTGPGVPKPLDVKKGPTESKGPKLDYDKFFAGKPLTKPGLDYGSFFAGKPLTLPKSVSKPSITVGSSRIPKLADGGVVTRPTLALIGEKGSEAVIPLNKAGGMGGAVYNITVNAGIGTNGQEVGKQIVEAIKKFERSSGPVFAKA
jgi:hypothetical protein